jgi:hypothetical protein
MKWVTVQRTNGVTEAELLCNMLESFGIPSRVSYESVGRLYGIIIDGLGVAAVLVPEDRAEEARELLSKPSPGEP